MAAVFTGAADKLRLRKATRGRRRKPSRRMAQLPAMKIRIGLHVGDVVLTDDDYLGNTVNKAARIAAAARGGEIVASSSVRSLLGDDPEFGFGEIQTVHLKGIEGLHEVAQVLPSKPG